MRNWKPTMNFGPQSSDISFFAPEPMQEGGIVCAISFSNDGSWDDPNSKIGLPNMAPQFGTAEGLKATIPLGTTLQEVVDYDHTRFARDMSDIEIVRTHSKVAVYSDFTGCTRRIASTEDLSALAGKPLYYDELGNFTTVANSPVVGTFMSNGDADGYVRVYIKKLPA